MGLTHLGDVLTHVFVEKPADGLRAASRALTGKGRNERRAERAARMEERKSARGTAKMVSQEEAKRLAHDAALRRAKLQMEAGQRLAASGAEELARLKAEDVLGDDTKSSKPSNGAGAKSSDDPAPAPKTRARRGTPVKQGEAGDKEEAGAEAETASSS